MAEKSTQVLPASAIRIARLEPAIGAAALEANAAGDGQSCAVGWLNDIGRGHWLSHQVEIRSPA